MLHAGGTPYKAYLRKHRDESMRHQVEWFGPSTLCAWHIPSHEAHQAEVRVPPSTVPSQPSHIPKRQRQSNTLPLWATAASALQIELALREDSLNGIPQHLLTRHGDIIAKYGGGSLSLQRKAYPSAAQISKWGVQHSATAPQPQAASTSSRVKL